MKSLRVPKVRSHKFRGKRFKLVIPGKGRTAYANLNPNVISIPTDITERKFLRWLLHEMTHACQWDLDEDAVDEISSDMAGALWKFGFRLKEK